jgi:hypothetical protein
MCRPFEGYRSRGQFGCGCSCGCCGFVPRLYFSREEERDWIEKYRDELKKELIGVEERLKELKKLK